MKLRLLLTTLAALTSLTAYAVKPVELVLTSKTLEPTTTFEIRFAETMVAAAEIGKEADLPPVIFRPAVKGHFTWLSERSGIFTPDEILPLSTTFQLALTPQLLRADEQPLVADFQATVKTPPMQIKGWNPIDYMNRENATATPKFAVLFNVSVDPATAKQFFLFADKTGREVRARVARTDDAEGAHPNFPKWRSNDGTLETWAERFAAKSAPAGTETAAHQNLLIVSPIQPLPSGEDWALIAKPGIPALDGDLTLAEESKIPIGTVRAFEVTSAEANNNINGARNIRLRFSKPLAKEVTAGNLARWIQIEPAPKHLTTSVENSDVTFVGDFELEKPYHLKVAAGLPALQPFVTAVPFEKTLTFQQVPPRLYLEEFATHQLTTGQRKFHLLAVNVPRVKVTAKIFPNDTVALAVAAYEKYFDTNRQRNDSDDSFAKVDPDSIPGHDVWQREIAGTTETDTEQTLTLDWNEILGAKKSGVVLLTAEQIGEGKHPGTQALVQITDLGVVWKRSAGECFVHVFSLATAAPVANAKVQVVDKNGVVFREAQTDASGIARVEQAGDTAWIFVESGSDRHLVDLNNENGALRARSLHNGSRFDDEDESADRDRPTFLFSDRPVYKPGETLHLKGIARDWRNGQTHIPAGAEVRLNAHDSRDRTFFEKRVKLSDSGALSEDVKLPAGVLGTFRVDLVYASEKADATPAATHEFEVQEYRSNAFEISVGGPKSAVGVTDLQLPVTAKYYMGKPLSTAQLNWSIEAGDEGFLPDGFQEFAFCNDIADYRLSRLLDRAGHFAQQGKATLDETGLATIAATVPLNVKAPQPRTARIVCEITDLDQQTVTESAVVAIHSSDFYLGIRRAKAVVREGEALPAQVIAVRPDGSPMADSVNATLRLTRIVWQTNRIVGAGNTDEYRSAAHFELAATMEVKTCAVSKSAGKWTTTGEATTTTPLVAGKPGEYLLEAATKDAEGRDVVTTTMLHVYGATETTWDYHNPYEIELVPDKEQYLAGDTATLLVKTPLTGEALVTIERENVLRSFVTKLRGNAPSVQIPLVDFDAPNVFVSVMMLRGADKSPHKNKRPEFRMGYCKLAVARPDSKLQISVDPETKAYRPGEPVKLVAQVLDVSNRPVENAEVTLYAVDEGVLSLMGYETPNPLEFFNTERALAVTTGLTLPSLLNEDAEERRFPNKGYLVGGGGEDSDSIRKNFLACAFWNGSLKTDKTGHVEAVFPAPDSLTRYRVIAVVQTNRDQFGSAQSAFEVNKPLMLEPAMPRFANVGDQLLLRAVLHNTTAFAGEAEIALELDDTATTEGKTRRVSLAAGGSIAVDFPVTFNAVGKGVWKWTARFVSADAPTAFRDSVQTELNVGYPAPLLREVRTSHTDAADTELLDTIDPQLLEGSGTVRVSVSNSRLLELNESLRELLHYPYGCVEQTTSSTLPWMTLRDMRDALPELQKTDEEITNAVNHGVDRLLKMQTDSGGLAYWPGESQPLFWGSAYGGFGLAMARQKGFTVPAEDFDRLMKYLSEQLRDMSGEKFDPHYEGGGPSDRCLALYALAVAGRAEPAYHEFLFKKRASLSRENRALLALAIAESKGSETMIAELLEAGAEDADSDRYFGSRTRTLAVRLLAWDKTKPAAPAVDALVNELLGARRGGHWVTTQGNAWSLLALADYARTAESAHRSAAGSLSWGAQTAAFALGDKPQMADASFALSAKDARSPLHLANPGKGRLFTEVTVEARPKLIAQPEQDRGYSIRRAYRKIADDGSLGEFAEAHVGDRVLVQLDIEVRHEAGYIAVDDPLPAILEAVNPVFKSQEMAAGPMTRDWLSDYHELREDRALFFAHNIQPGHYAIRYLARVCAAGTATAPAAKIEEMYHPERCGISATTKLASLPLP